MDSIWLLFDADSFQIIGKSFMPRPWLNHTQFYASPWISTTNLHEILTLSCNFHRQLPQVWIAICSRESRIDYWCSLWCGISQIGRTQANFLRCQYTTWGYTTEWFPRCPNSLGAGWHVVPRIIDIGYITVVITAVLLILINVLGSFITEERVIHLDEINVCGGVGLRKGFQL